MPAKICAICGEDCSSKPRTKDAAGHYYCRECHEAALRKRRAAARPTPRPEPPPSIAPPDDGDAYGILGALVEEAQAEAGVIHCPGCGAEMPAGAVICTNCGLNMHTGRALEAAVPVVAPPVVAGGGGGAVWPIVIGVLSIVYAVVDGGFIAINMIDRLGSGSAYGIGALIGSLIPGILAVILLYAGIRVIMRRQDGAATIRQWAVVKTVLSVVCGGIALAGAMMIGDTSDMAAMMGDDVMLQAREVMITVLLVGLVWNTAWSVFIWIWFSRDAVRKQVGAW